MIKVKETFQHQGHVVCKGKLALIPQDGKFNAPNMYIKEKGHFTPIIISETEEIEIGDNILNHLKNDIIELKDLINIHPNCKKILALPEHFSPELLQMIVDGKLKDGEIVYLEVEKA